MLTATIRSRCAAIVFIVVSGIFAPLSSASAAVIDLTTVFSNSSYESGTTAWTATKPNANYQSLGTNFGVNPTILPLDPCCSNGTTLPQLTAPVGSNFIGVLNPDDADLAGKLAHTAVSGTFLSTDTYQVTVWANLGRLGDGNTNSIFTSAPPTLNVQLRSWIAGAVPTVAPATDSWSRSPTTTTTLAFTNWGSPGIWTSQTFLFTLPANRAYLSLGIAGLNHSHDSYVAWDVGTPVPEPSSVLLLGAGIAALVRRRFRNGLRSAISVK